MEVDIQSYSTRARFCNLMTRNFGRTKSLNGLKKHWVIKCTLDDGRLQRMESKYLYHKFE